MRPPPFGVNAMPRKWIFSSGASSVSIAKCCNTVRSTTSISTLANAAPMQRLVPPPTAWVPFGGGTRRCIGAAFANVEMDVVLRTVLRHFVIETDDAPDEKIHFRGIAFTPKDGGRILVRRRESAAA